MATGLQSDAPAPESGAVLTDLTWLPPCPPDFKARVNALPLANGATGAELQALATSQLNPGQASRLARALDRCRRAGTPLDMSNFRLGIASNATIDIVTDFIPIAALRRRVAAEIVVAPFGQVMQQAYDPGSQLNQAQCDAILLALDFRAFGLGAARFEGAAEFVDRQARELADAVRAFRTNSSAAIILQSLAQPPEPIFGNFDRRAEGSVRWQVERMNTAIWRIAAEEGAYMADIGGLAEQVGTQAWFDAAAWNAYKMPFAGHYGPIYAEWLGRLIGAIRGTSRKCLVLDLDNTCWGGVIGDDGLEGIRLGQGHAIGEAHLAVQQMALDLRARGIILAVASKNDDATARLPFREHEEMLLREEHIAVFQANWIDKPANLEAIARTLNIGLDALVMLDDNPAERAQIRAALPQVAVPELPADPAQFTRYLAAAGYFEATAFSPDDRIRAQSYAADARRAEVRETTRNLEDYLQSLDMVISLRPFDALNRPRITQLINKTNQFNLTTQRYSEAQVETFETDPAAVTVQVRLRDRFGDMGIIGVVIARRAGDTLDIDSWLMSCRVLGRNVEEAMLAHVVDAARAAGATRITAHYIPSSRNGMVCEMFDTLGFALIDEDTDGVRHYAADIRALPEPALPMRRESMVTTK